MQKLFNPSYQNNQGPQGQSVQSNQSVNKDSSSQGSDDSQLRPSAISSTSVSRLQFDDSFKNSLHSLLTTEDPYAEIIRELSAGRTNVRKSEDIYKMSNGIVLIYSSRQDADLDFWRVVIPDNEEIRNIIVQELHSIPYSAYPGIQRTMAKVGPSFYCKGMSGHVREFVEQFPVYQMENSDHTLNKDKLQSIHIPENKWTEVSIDFITEFPMSCRNKDSILVVVDEATRIVHLAPWSKNIISTDAVKCCGMQ